MPNLSNYAESGVLSHLLRTSTFPKPGNISIGLLTKLPLDSDDGTTVTEPSMANNYARVNLGAPADSAWAAMLQDTQGSGYFTNVSGITFNPCLTADWNYISGIGIFDSPGVGSGAALFLGTVSPAQLVQVNTTFSISIGNLKIAAN